MDDPCSGRLTGLLDSPRSGSYASGASAAERRLDLHEGIAPPGLPDDARCGRWPEHFHLRNDLGEIVRGRCRATKKCTYCGRLGAVENAEMVALDALTYAPTLYVVLTTRDPTTTREEVRRHLEHTWRAVRRRWPEAEYACFVEFTTGLSVWSGGHRRIHLNLLVKGVTDEDGLRDVLLSTWGRRTDTTHLHVGPVYAAEGLVRYVTNLALHVMKDGQKPPPTYEGHLIRWSRGYFPNGATAQRADARRALIEKRELWKLLRDHPDVDAHTAEEVVADRLAFAGERTWQLVQTKPLTADRPDSLRGERTPPPMGRRG
jgi:hypothetical protein